MIIPDDWIQMLNNVASPEVRARLLSASGAELEAFLNRASDPVPSVAGVLAEYLDRTIDEHTWDAMSDGIAAYLGVNASYAISWICSPTDENRVEDAIAYAPTPVHDLLRFIVGRFGSQIRNAMTMRTDLADDWQSVTPWVFEDKLSGTYRLRLELTKTTGERVFLEGPPSSMMGLARFMLVMLNAVPADTLTSGSVDDFVAQAAHLIAALGPAGSTDDAAESALASSAT